MEIVSKTYLSLSSAKWRSVDSQEELFEEGYFSTLAPIPNVVSAVKEITNNHPDIEVYFLSAVLTDSKYALKEKNDWLNYYLPEIDNDHRIFPPCGQDKANFVPGGVRRTDFLLDDYTKNLITWNNKGQGIKLLNGINHNIGTWAHDCIRYDRDPSSLVSAIISVINGNHVYDKKPQDDDITPYLFKELEDKFVNDFRKSEIKPGDIIYSTIQLDGTEQKAKRLLFVADVNKDQELTCLNITSAKTNKDHDLFEADQPIPKTATNGLNRDSYVKTNVEYILSASNYKFKMDKINLSQEDSKKVMSRYNKMKQKGKVKRADNQYDKKSEFDRLNQKVMDLTQQFKESPETLYDYQQFSARFYQFSARNTALIYAQNKHATFVASYSDWKNKFEYNVKRDMKAIYLLRPVTNEFFKRDNKLVPVSEATEAEKQKIAKKELEIHKDTYFVRYPVYDISQTTCPKKDYPKVYDMGYKSLDHILRYECVKQFAQGEGFTVSEKPIDSISLHGYYSPSDNSIVISDKLDDSKKLSTLCHEVSHGLMHKTSTAPTSVKEFEAESLSVMMCTRMGVDPEQSSARYLSSHYNKIDHEKYPTQKSMERIKKAFDYSDTKIQKNIQSNPAFQMEMEKQQSHKQPKQQEDSPGKMASGGKPQNFIQH